MPSYDYHCTANNRVVEVRHGMNERLRTWGEVCEHAGIGLDGVSADAPVSRMVYGGAFVNSSALKNPEPSCASGACCGGGMCGI